MGEEEDDGGGSYEKRGLIFIFFVSSRFLGVRTQEALISFFFFHTRLRDLKRTEYSRESREPRRPQVSARLQEEGERKKGLGYKLKLGEIELKKPKLYKPVDRHLGFSPFENSDGGRFLHLTKRYGGMEKMCL